MKKLFSGLLAASVAATAFAGLTITASAVSDQVMIKPKDAENYTTLSSSIKTLDGGVSFDAATGTLSFTQNIELTEVKLVDGNAYGSCLAARAEDKIKNLTISIPSGITVTMNNGNVAGWSAAVYGGVAGDITVTGGGTLDVYGLNYYAISPYNSSFVIDGANVIARGGQAAVGEPSQSGSITIKNGGSLTATCTVGAFKQMEGKVTVDSGATILAGETYQNNAAVGLTDALTSSKYKWVRITAPTPVATEEPTENPTTAPTDEPSEEVKTPTGIRIGGTDIYEEAPNWTQGDVTAEYDKGTNTLTLSGTGTINGPSGEDGYGFGGAIYATKALNIIVAKDANIILNAGPGKAGWSCGIYTYDDNAQITIGGEGKLTVNSESNDEYAIAICPYSKQTLKQTHNGYDLTLKGSVDVTANGSKYGVYTHQNKVGWIQITEKASLTASGATEAIHVNDFSEGYIYGGSRSFVGTVNGGAWNVSDVMTAKSLSIKPAAFSQETSEAITGLDNATGFVTTVTGEAGVTIKCIKWRITHGEKTKELAPSEKPIVTLAQNASAVFAVIVNGFSDPIATAVAVIE